MVLLDDDQTTALILGNLDRLILGDLDRSGVDGGSSHRFDRTELQVWLRTQVMLRAKGREILNGAGEFLNVDASGQERLG